MWKPFPNSPSAPEAPSNTPDYMITPTVTTTHAGIADRWDIKNPTVHNVARNIVGGATVTNTGVRNVFFNA